MVTEMAILPRCATSKPRYHRQLAVENFPEVEVEVKTLTGKCEPPPPRCSFARHLVGKMAIQAAHLLITKHQPVDTHLIN